MRSKAQNKQNMCLPRAKCFNTRGYYDSNLPFDQQYLNAKMEAFQKYREKQAPLRVLDAICTNKQLQEQKNLILFHCKHKIVESSRKQTQSTPRAKMHTINCDKSTCFMERSQSKSQLPQVGERRVHNIWKNYLERKENVNFREKTRYKVMPTISTRINTEDITSRRHSCTSHSFARQGIKRQTNMLIIEDDNCESKQN